MVTSFKRYIKCRGLEKQAVYCNKNGLRGVNWC
jgi:hypothetical protein